MIKKTLLSIGITVGLLACTADKKNAEYSWKVDKPFSKEIIPFEEFSVHNQNDTVLYLENGSSIEIPTDCFVDKNGQTVNDSVVIKYRAFNSAAELFISGIPMKYDTAGVRQNFISAGMVEVRGFKNNEPIFFAEGKTANINIASDKGDRNFNFYELNEGDNWKYKSTLTAKKNERKLAIKAQIEKELKTFVKPVVEGPDVEVFDFQLSYREFEEMKTFKNVLWAVCDPSKKTFVQGLFDQSWTDIKLSRSNKIGAFIMSLKNGSDVVKVEIQPVYAQKDVKKAMAAFTKMEAQYTADLEDRLVSDALYTAQKTFIRSANISRFGISNCDRFSVNKDFIAQKCAVDLPSGTTVDKEKLSYYVFENNNNIVRYSYAGLQKLKYFPKRKNVLLTVLSDKKIAYTTEFPKTVKDEFKVSLKEKEFEISTASDFQKLISELN
jgi:hypothetical protein